MPSGPNASKAKVRSGRSVSAYSGDVAPQVLGELPDRPTGEGLTKRDRPGGGRPDDEALVVIAERGFLLCGLGRAAEAITAFGRALEADPVFWRQGQAPRDDHPMADVIFFDLDGTLVDHRSAVLETIGQIVQAAPNATAPPEELVPLWWTLEARHMREYLAGQCSFAEHHRRRLRSFLPMLGEPVPESPGLLDAWIAERYLTVFEESWRCYPDVQPCMETLKRLPRGPRLAVLTNGDPEQQRAKLARFGLLEYFEAVLTPAELGVAKPVAYAAACRWMRTDPAQAVNVGDMLESDVHAAARAGLTGIWLDRGIDFVTGGPSPTADETVLRIERLTDLPDHLSRSNV
jgi:putative hydrolase of the HAD superfamily